MELRYYGNNQVCSFHDYSEMIRLDPEAKYRPTLFVGTEIEIGHDDISYELDGADIHDIGFGEAEELLDPYIQLLANEVDLPHVYDKDDLIAFELDGSVSEGMEVITGHASLVEYEAAYQAMFRAMRECGMQNTSEYQGMHVHIGQEYIDAQGGSDHLSYDVVARLLRFMNHEGSVEKLSRIAGRSYRHIPYCAPRTSRWFAEHQDLSDQQLVEVFSGDSKYVPLAVRGEDTLEFRIFGSTSRWDEHLGRVQFAHALVRYAMETTSEIVLEEFIKWLKLPRVRRAYGREYHRVLGLFNES